MNGQEIMGGDGRGFEMVDWSEQEEMERWIDGWTVKRKTEKIPSDLFFTISVITFLWAISLLLVTD